MLRHFLMIANRNLLKYKVQNIISVASLAVGITTLVLVQCVLFMLRKPGIYSQPYADRCYSVTVVNPDYYEVNNSSCEVIRDDIDNLLRGSGPMSSVEALYPTNYSTESSWVSFTMQDGTVRNKAMDLQPIYNEYPVFHGFTSAVTGQPVSALGRNEIIMSESMACKIFGDVNHIGSTVSFNVYGRDMDFMLADVYQDLSWTESLPAYIQFSIWDPGQYRVTDQYVIYYELLLRDGYTVEQFKEEADSRLKPMGLVAKVSRLEDAPVQTNNISMITRSLVWLIGSMILVVALISFIRMQIQLLRMRRREFSLRLINGASGRNLFFMLLTENVIIVLVSAVISWILIQWLKSYGQNRLFFLLDGLNWKWSGVYTYLSGIGLAVIVICAAMIAVSLRRVIRSNGNLQDNLRSTDSLFHKAMLVLQTTICMLFISGTISVLMFVGGMRQKMHVPDNDSFYKQCVMVRGVMVDNKWELGRQLEECRYAARVIPFSEEFSYGRPDENDTIRKIIEGAQIALLRNYVTPDTGFFDFFGTRINWLLPAPDDSYILVSEKLFSMLREAGYGAGCMLRTFDGRMLPVVGTYPPLPYSSLKSEMVSMAVITHDRNRAYDQFIMEPVKGQYQDLLSEARYLYGKANPEMVDVEVYNMRDLLGSSVNIFDAMRVGALILSSICLVICIMSIYSTLLLSIRSRRKEVAIRKVNGARRADVLLLFGRLYMVMALISFLISAPLGVLINKAVIMMGDGYLEPGSIHAWIPVGGACLFTLLFITITVFGNIRRIMRLNPTDYIAKE